VCYAYDLVVTIQYKVTEADIMLYINQSVNSYAVYIVNETACMMFPPYSRCSVVVGNFPLSTVGDSCVKYVLKLINVFTAYHCHYDDNNNNYYYYYY